MATRGADRAAIRRIAPSEQPTFMPCCCMATAKIATKQPVLPARLPSWPSGGLRWPPILQLSIELLAEALVAYQVSKPCEPG